MSVTGILLGMDTQTQVKRTLSQPAAIAYVQELLGRHGVRHRTALADAVCEHFGFHDARGAPQRAGCLKAQRELEAAGGFTLPAVVPENPK